MTAAVVISLALTVAGVAVAPLIRSPAQIAAEAAPPTPVILSAAVERRVLIDTVIVRGEVTAGLLEHTPAVGEDGARPVVTAIRTRVGAPVKAGEVLLEVAGRPMFALPGGIPMYRDMRPGSKGKDVLQLQKALRSMGYATSRLMRWEKGAFGPRTKTALSRLYDAIGFDAMIVGEEEAAAAAQTVRSAARALEAAVIALKRELRDGSSGDSVADARLAVRWAREDMREAQDALDDATSRSGPILPWAEAVFLPAFPAHVQELNVSLGASVEPPAIVLSSGVLRVHANLNPAERGLIKPGLLVEIFSEDTAVSVPGTLTTIGDAQLDEGQTRSHPLVIQPAKPLPPTLTGQQVRVTIAAASTEDPVLVVPIAAVSAGADGRTTVSKLIAGGLERVEVVVGVSGDGYCEIRPVSGSLDIGERVVIG